MNFIIPHTNGSQCMMYEIRIGLTDKDFKLVEKVLDKIDPDFTVFDYMGKRIK